MKEGQSGLSDEDLSSVYLPSDRDVSSSLLGDDSDSVMEMVSVNAGRFATRDVNHGDHCTFSSLD
mgnify:FL=1